MPYLMPYDDLRGSLERCIQEYGPISSVSYSSGYLPGHFQPGQFQFSFGNVATVHISAHQARGLIDYILPFITPTDEGRAMIAALTPYGSEEDAHTVEVSISNNAVQLSGLTITEWTDRMGTLLDAAGIHVNNLSLLTALAYAFEKNDRTLRERVDYLERAAERQRESLRTRDYAIEHLEHELQELQAACDRQSDARVKSLVRSYREASTPTRKLAAFESLMEILEDSPSEPLPSTA